jgi:hypothetical protein
MNWSEVSGYLFGFAVASHHPWIGNSAAFSGERSGCGSTFGVWTGFAAPAWSGLGSMIVGQVPCHCEFSHCIRPKEVRPIGLSVRMEVQGPGAAYCVRTESCLQVAWLCLAASDERTASRATAMLAVVPLCHCKPCLTMVVWRSVGSGACSTKHLVCNGGLLSRVRHPGEVDGSSWDPAASMRSSPVIPL